MARAALRWTLEELAKRAGVHRNTVSNYETEKFGGDAQSLAAIRRALHAAGIEFIDENGGGAGVRLKSGRRSEGIRPQDLTSENDG
jgi:transcriptional regulator with XRE-family HTH domain